MRIKQFRNVNGYTNSAAEVKAEFLRTGKKVLRAVGKALADKGYVEQDIRVNKAGPAVSGEVCADFFKQDNPIGVWFQWFESAVGGGGTAILYRWTERRKRGKHTATGPNQWLTVDGDIDIDALADKAAKQAEARQAFTGKLC